MKMNKLFLLLLSSFFLFSCVKKTCTPVPIIPVKQDTTKNCSHLVTTWAAEKTVSVNNITKAYFVSESIGWLSGSNGTILKTTDGGQTFAAQNSTTTQIVYNMQFIDKNIGYAVGGNTDPQGMILKTTDGGTTWTIILNNISTCRGMYFINSTTGFVGGSSGMLLKTTDGGQTWSTLITSITGSIYEIQFVDANIGYLSGAKGEIYKTIDGGSSWTNLPNTMPNGLNDAYFGIHFLDKDNGYLCGHSATNSTGYLIKTTNGGTSWTYLTAPSYGLQDIQMIDVNTGYAVGGTSGSSGQILKITNGNTWTVDKTASNEQQTVSLYGCTNALSAGRNGVTVLGQ